MRGRKPPRKDRKGMKQEITREIRESYGVLIENALEDGRPEDAKELAAEMKDQLKRWRTWR